MNGTLMIIGKVKDLPKMMFAGKQLIARVEIRYSDYNGKLGLVELVAYNKFAKIVNATCKKDSVCYFECELKPVVMGACTTNELNIIHLEKLYEGQVKTNKDKLELIKSLDPLSYLGGKK